MRSEIFHTVAPAQAASFSKEQVFLKLKIFFKLTMYFNSHILTNIIAFSFFKNKFNVALENHFVGVRNYLTFKVSSWERSCTVSFATDFIDPILKSSYKVISRKSKIVTHQEPVCFRTVAFSTISTLKVKLLTVKL